MKVNTMDNIIQILQKYIDNLANKKWREDPCKPEFIISVINNKDCKIILTIRHAGRSFSEIIFPGYIDSLYYYMEQLYNMTM